MDKKVREQTRRRRAEQRKMSSGYRLLRGDGGDHLRGDGADRHREASNWFDPGKFWSGDGLPLAPATSWVAKSPS